MDTLATPISMFNLLEPIPGYKLRERIGAGGYGEVWRAEAPGGLSKAVKIVHGPLSEARADRELKALNRIKLVQHPLLLSLERFEVVDGHLIIVTELAHGSLKDRFQQCVDAGQRGIARDELLAYLRDVADALDHLYEHDSLQHLDVKPENLLLVADRVKVADFGLVKDLHDQSSSLVGGLTPLYAPPELFDGRPSPHSDQYSLAVVYQELLTGDLPFNGRTLAQLAAQHLHSNPCLDVLPRADQPVIARALSKDPRRRFSNSRELISKLMEAPRVNVRARRPRAPSEAAVKRQDSKAAGTTTTVSTKATIEFPEPTDVRSLPPLDLGEQAAFNRPTLLVGLGSTGAIVLRKLRARLNQRALQSSSLPRVEMLLLDTDTRALSAASLGDQATAISPVESVPMPLRQPQEYRENSEAILEWISRRWLFNIPRSLQTQGLRPLGRLAFVDHFASVSEALRDALLRVVEDHVPRPHEVETSAAPERVAPQVFVVAATGGGTGGGAVADLGYALRTLFTDLNLTNASLHGMLLFSTPRRVGGKDLAIANTLCLLNELQCYASPTGYPGEPSCDLPPSDHDQGPFDHTYLIHLGNDLADDQWEAKTGEFAEYLYQNVATRAAAFFQRCRDATERDAATLRSGGVSCLNVRETLVQDYADRLAQALIQLWLGNGKRKVGGHQASEALQGLSSDRDQLHAWIHARIVNKLGDLSVAVARLVEEARVEADSSCGTVHRRELAQVWASRVDARILRLTDDSDDSLQTLLEPDVTRHVASLSEQLQVTLRAMLNASSPRIGDARQELSRLQDELAAFEQRIDHDLQAFEHVSAKPSSPDVDAMRAHAAFRLQHLGCRLAWRLVRGLRREVRAWHQRLHAFANRLCTLQGTSASDDSPQDKLEDLLRAAVDELVEKLHNELLVEMKRRQITVFGLLAAEEGEWNQFRATLRACARNLSTLVITRLQVMTALDARGRGAGHTDSTQMLVQGATPLLLCCGGSKRMLLVASGQTSGWDGWKKPFDDAAGGEVHLVLDQDESLTVCGEVQDIPLQNVLAYLSQGRDDYLKLASRLHTRIDVDWPHIQARSAGD